LREVIAGYLQVLVDKNLVLPKEEGIESIESFVLEDILPKTSHYTYA